MKRLSTRLGMVVAVVVLVTGATTREAHGQRWLQTVEVITPVEQGSATAALLDTLVALARERDLAVRRSPDHEPLAFDQLEDIVLAEGFDFTSANRVFLTYRFEMDRNGFSSEITRLYFIYRAAGMDQTDVPIWSLDARESAVRHVLHESGTQLRTNEAAFVPFIDQMMFYNLDESTVVSVGGRVIRGEQQAAAERKRLMATIRRFMYR